MCGSLPSMPCYIPYPRQTPTITAARVHSRTSPSVGLNPFRTAVPFWGQTASNLSGLSPKRDCGSKRVKYSSTSGATCTTSGIQGIRGYPGYPTGTLGTHQQLVSEEGTRGSRAPTGIPDAHPQLCVSREVPEDLGYPRWIPDAHPQLCVSRKVPEDLGLLRASECPG